jgi:hypothetical protein
VSRLFLPDATNQLLRFLIRLLASEALSVAGVKSALRAGLQIKKNYLGLYYVFPMRTSVGIYRSRNCRDYLIAYICLRDSCCPVMRSITRVSNSVLPLSVPAPVIANLPSVGR